MAASLRVQLGWYRLLARLERTFAFRPHVEVLEQDDVHVLLLDVPGVRKDDLDVRVVDHHLLTISGERRREFERKRRAPMAAYTERRYGLFSRTIELPRNADPARMTIELHDGVLTIHVPRLEASRSRVFHFADRDAARSTAPAHASS